MYENMNGFNGGMGMMGNIPQGTGYQYNGMQPNAVPQAKNNLTDEEIQKLIQKDNTFSLAVTETEKLKASCNHRDNKTGRDTIIEDPETGNCRCYICGYEFNPIDASVTKDNLFESVKEVTDILQTIKMLYLDMPADVAREFFVIIPLLNKIPDLFERAAKCYARYDSVNAFGYNNKNMNTMQMYNILTNVLNGGPVPQQQPGFNPGFNGQQPMPGYDPYMGMNMGQSMMGYQQPMMSNGFVAQPQQGYAPQTGGFAYVPGQQPMNNQAPVGASTMQQPVEQTATTDGKTVDVQATVKA